MANPHQHAWHAPRAHAWQLLRAHIWILPTGTCTDTVAGPLLRSQYPTTVPPVVRNSHSSLNCIQTANCASPPLLTVGAASRLTCSASSSDKKLWYMKARGFHDTISILQHASTVTNCSCCSAAGTNRPCLHQPCWAPAAQLPLLVDIAPKTAVTAQEAYISAVFSCRLSRLVMPSIC